jgi:uncharacterized protein YecE (DUF72 family)
MGRIGRLRIGTSGWVYKQWKGVVYPAGLPTRRWLAHYAELFDTVEVNNSFYRMPSDAAFHLWGEQVPANFLFAVKASRYITHMKKLKDPEGPVELFLGRARELGRHLGPILYQLPPGWSVDIDRFRHFLSILPADLTHVVEFRDPSWYTGEVRSALAEHGVAFCVHDLRGELTPEWVTGRAVYVRFHGPTARAYAGAYSSAQLRVWATRIERWQRAGHDVYAYFNNDNSGHAIANARGLRSLLGAFGLRPGSSPGSETQDLLAPRRPGRAGS